MKDYPADMPAPKLKWDGPYSGDYLIQSEKRIDEPRTFYALLLSSPRGGRVRWQGPTRINRRSAEIDAEYHASQQPDQEITKFFGLMGAVIVGILLTSTIMLGSWVAFAAFCVYEMSLLKIVRNGWR